MDYSAAAKELKEEMTLRRDFASQEEAVILSYLFTSQRMEKLAYAFFASHGLSDAQFNVLILLWDLRNRKVHQWELADMLLVNRASIGGLIDRMLRKSLLKRSPDPEDRRALCVSLTPKGNQMLERVKNPYYAMLAQAFDGFAPPDLDQFLRYLNLFRKKINAIHDQIKGRGASIGETN